MSCGLSILLGRLLLGIGGAVRKKSDKILEKKRPFECGFEPLRSAERAFSLQFFLVALIFAVFDVEVILLFPVISPLVLGMFTRAPGAARLFVCVVLLFTGSLILEWKGAMLE